MFYTQAAYRIDLSATCHGLSGLKVYSNSHPDPLESIPNLSAGIATGMSHSRHAIELIDKTYQCAWIVNQIP